MFSNRVNKYAIEKIIEKISRKFKKPIFKQIIFKSKNCLFDKLAI